MKNVEVKISENDCLPTHRLKIPRSLRMTEQSKLTRLTCYQRHNKVIETKSFRVEVLMQVKGRIYISFVKL